MIEDRTALLNNLTVFQPVFAVNNIAIVVSDILTGITPILRWLFPLLFLLWNLIAAIGRTLVLRRLDRTLHPRRIALFLLGTLRSALLLAAWYFWFRLVVVSAHIAITAPAARNEEPSVVLFAALVIAATLALYVLWAIFSWFLQLAPLVATEHNLSAFAALRIALRSPARSKLIEINLVLHIVRIALIVLAMVFSATPLPFSTVTTPEFLHLWWAGVGLGYLLLSNYFHVVRAASYLALYRAETA